jgi:hypothetical protein
MTASVADLSNNYHSIPFTDYFWKSKLAVSVSDSLAADIQSIISTSYPDSDSILDSIKSLDLRPFSNEVASTAQNVSAQISSTVKNSSDSIIFDMKDNLHAFHDSIMDSARKPVDQVKEIFSSALTEVNIVFKSVLFYDGFRYIVISDISETYALWSLAELFSLLYLLRPLDWLSRIQKSPKAVIWLPCCFSC